MYNSVPSKSCCARRTW